LIFPLFNRDLLLASAYNSDLKPKDGSSLALRLLLRKLLAPMG